MRICPLLLLLLGTTRCMGNADCVRPLAAKRRFVRARRTAKSPPGLAAPEGDDGTEDDGGDANMMEEEGDMAVGFAEEFSHRCSAAGLQSM
jgi:hypothetical protein